jgi:hypothetical protein
MVPLAGDRLALLIVTELGATVAVAKRAGPGCAIVRQASSLRRALSFPTISAVGDHLLVAVMADHGQPSAEILTGRIALADLT